MLIHKLRLAALTLLFLGRRRHRRRVSGPLAGDEGRTREEPRRASDAAGSPDGSTARRRPDPGPGRMTVTGRVLDPTASRSQGAVVDVIGAAPRAVGRRDRRGRRPTRPARPGPDRRRRPLPPRRGPHLVGPLLRGLRPGRRARLRPRLGRAEPRRRAARGRDPAPPRAGHPRPAGRRAAASRPRASRSASASVGRPTEQRTWSTASRSGTNPPEGLRAWPRPVKTDDQGRFDAHRHRPRRSPSASPSATPASPGRISHRSAADDRDGQGDVTLALQPATDHRGPRPGRRHRPARSPTPSIAVRGQPRARSAACSRPSSAPTTRADSRPTPSPGDYFRVSAFPPEGQPYLVPAGRIRVDQGGRQEGDRHQAPPRRPDPRQGDRGGDRPPAGRRPASSSSRSEAGDDMLWRLAGDRGQQGRRLVPDRRPARQGAPARLRPDRPTTSSRRSAAARSTTVSPAGCATTPTPSSPTRSRPATRPTRSPPRCGRARRSRAASSGPTAQTVDRRRRSSRRSTSSRSTPPGAATTSIHGPRRPLRAARARPREAHARSLSSTPTTSGARRSSSPASRPART